MISMNSAPNFLKFCTFVKIAAEAQFLPRLLHFTPNKKRFLFGIWFIIKFNFALFGFIVGHELDNQL